ncbi:MAG: methyltransferase domain-containing protein [Rikenellaceae bacterium]
MQKRHKDNKLYFNESATSSRKYYVDYIMQYKHIDASTRVFEIGCGLGGNLLPLLENGCYVYGVDLSIDKIEAAKEMYDNNRCNCKFEACDFFITPNPTEDEKFDIIIIHDVIEHISDKTKFLSRALDFLKSDGIIFWAFPAWQMPFGGHQQICRSWLCSHTPFVHLLPKFAYEGLLKMCGESNEVIAELLDIKECGVSVERFENLCESENLEILDRTLWFINPHYEQKFKLKPRRLWSGITHIRHIRNLFTTSCFYITKHN